MRHLPGRHCSLILFLCLILLSATDAAAQKKEISQARDWVKAGSNLDRAEASMRQLLADTASPANRLNAKIWTVLFDAERKQYEQLNEKMYLRQQYDTAALFNTASRMYADMTAYDSIDCLPDKHGHVEPKMRKQNASLLNTLRPNLYVGGRFFLKRKDYNAAYNFFNQYIGAAEQPLFAAYAYKDKDRQLPQAAYWAVYSAYKMGDVSKALRHTYLALKDTANQENMLQYLAAIYLLDGDTARSIATCRDGFDRYPSSPFFFPHLVRHYSSHRQWDKALSLTNRAIAADTANAQRWLVKASILLNTARYDECFAICDSLLQRGDTVPEADLNAGLALFNKAVAIDKQSLGKPKATRQVRQLYQQAMPYMERYRAQRPDDTDKWALPLYTIYLNLNMGAKFDEVDAIIRKGK